MNLLLTASVAVLLAASINGQTCGEREIRIKVPEMCGGPKGPRGDNDSCCGRAGPPGPAGNPGYRGGPGEPGQCRGGWCPAGIKGDRGDPYCGYGSGGRNRCSEKGPRGDPGDPGDQPGGYRYQGGYNYQTQPRNYGSSRRNTYVQPAEPIYIPAPRTMVAAPSSSCSPCPNVCKSGYRRKYGGGYGYGKQYKQGWPYDQVSGWGSAFCEGCCDSYPQWISTSKRQCRMCSPQCQTDPSAPYCGNCCPIPRPKYDPPCKQCSSDCQYKPEYIGKSQCSGCCTRRNKRQIVDPAAEKESPRRQFKADIFTFDNEFQLLASEDFVEIGTFGFAVDNDTLFTRTGDGWKLFSDLSDQPTLEMGEQPMLVLPGLEE